MVNTATLKLIKDFEGVRYRAYKDSVGKWTIGVGHLILPGEQDLITKVLTDTEVDALLQTDLTKAEKAVDAFVKVPLNDNQRGALVSFVFNLGGGRLASSTLLELVNEKQFDEAASEFPKWSNAGGKRVVGLVRRREAEKQLFLTLV